jgi:hypothetical protein
MRINPTNQPSLRALNPRIHGKASGLTQIVKNWEDRQPQAGTEKQQHRWEKKRETKLPNKRKNVEPQGKDHMTLPLGVLGLVLELPVSISCH